MGKTMFEMGTILDDKWVILELIGKGAMGEVYRAHQSNLSENTPPARRAPWEGFDDVGFRTKVDVIRQ